MPVALIILKSSNLASFGLISACRGSEVVKMGVEVIGTVAEAAGDRGSPIKQFYHGKTVFVTGATGFMGKVLVEKLLRSTTLSKIYLLIRPKKGVATQTRLKQLLEARIFDKLRVEDKEALNRVEAVSGDITEEHLGLSFEEER